MIEELIITVVGGLILVVLLSIFKLLHLKIKQYFIKCKKYIKYQTPKMIYHKKLIINKIKRIPSTEEYIKLERKRLDGFQLTKNEQKSIYKYKQNNKYPPRVYSTKENEQIRKAMNEILHNPPHLTYTPKYDPRIYDLIKKK